jgi:L-asparaginase II
LGKQSGVFCTRNGIVESVHRVHAVAVDVAGETVAVCGDEGLATIYRSAAKPFQALPLVEEGVVDRFGISPEELALCAASHNGEPAHLEGVTSILEKVGVSREALRLGPHAPLRAETAEALFRSGSPLLPLHNNCSGQHAGMLGLARLKGWPLDSYLEPDHPLQQRMFAEMQRFTGMANEEIRIVSDGCGMLAFVVPLGRMALSFSRLAVAAGTEEGPRRIVGAMTSHPFMVGGTGRLCTALPTATRGRILGKLGAEGVYGMSIPGAGLGIAVKVEDGGMRAGDVAAVGVLEELDLLGEAELTELAEFRRKVVRNTLGDEVGEIRAEFSMARKRRP